MTLTPEEYEAQDATGLADLVRSGQIGAAELFETFLARVEALNPALNAVIEPIFDAARAAIGRGLPEGPFTGVPYLIKNLHAPAAGTVLSSGSRFAAGTVCDFDSETVARLRRAGFVIAGRTNSPEFGMNASTEPAFYGPTHNPWKQGHSAGGSSGGAAAAVASGMLPATHATDSGGSIRIPAGWCGLVGLKPTRGRNPTGPNRGNVAEGVSHEHAVSRTVRDTAAILDATAGPDVGAPYYAPPPPRPFLDEVGADPGTLRIALTTEAFSGVPVEPVCKEAAEATARLLADMGHQVEAAAPNFDGKRMGDAMTVFLLCGLTAQIETVSAARGRPPQEDEFEPVTWQALQKAQGYRGIDYAHAIAAFNTEVRALARFFADYDLLVTPTAAVPAPKLGVMSTQTDDAMAFMAMVYSLCPFTAPFNGTGQPAISLPMHWSDDGLPVGVQLVARYAEDALLLRVAAKLEEAKPWFDKRPRVASPEPALA